MHPRLGNWICNPGTCPDRWELNRWPFGLQANAQRSHSCPGCYHPFRYIPNSGIKFLGLQCPLPHPFPGSPNMPVFAFYTTPMWLIKANPGEECDLCLPSLSSRSTCPLRISLRPLEWLQLLSLPCLYGSNKTSRKQRDYFEKSGCDCKALSLLILC